MSNREVDKAHERGMGKQQRMNGSESHRKSLATYISAFYTPYHYINPVKTPFSGPAARGEGPKTKAALA